MYDDEKYNTIDFVQGTTHERVASFNMNCQYPNVSSNIKKGIAQLNLYINVQLSLFDDNVQAALKNNR